MSPRISIIAAISKTTRALGKNNGLLWRLPEDLKRFKALTTGHTIVMGRKTFDSIGRALPGRTNIVISADPACLKDGCTMANSIEDALEKARSAEPDEVFIIGGGTVYAAALPHVDRLYLTLVDDPGEGADTFFPEYEKLFPNLIEVDGQVRADSPAYIYATFER